MMMKMWLCVAALVVLGPAATARSAEAPAEAEKPRTSAWGGYAPANSWKAHRPEASWRGYAPQAGWKAAPTLGPLARRGAGDGRDLVTVERPPLAGRR